MLRQLFFIVALIFVALLATSFAQDPIDPEFEQHQQPQQQTVTLTRETVDALLQVLSPKCRNEFEASLDSRAQPSMECNIEIQQALPRFLSAQNEGLPPDGIDGSYDGLDGYDEVPNTAPRKARKAAAPTEGGINPLYGILAFITVAFVAVAALVVYLNSIRKDLPIKKPKKLSKKKEEKLKMKGGRPT